MDFILASASPRRKELLEGAGYSFKIIVPNIEEIPRAKERPGVYVRRMAFEKAKSVGEEHKGQLVLAADTIVVLGQKILQKPTDRRNAIAMLRKLRNRTHMVYSACSWYYDSERKTFLVRSKVHFWKFSDEDIRRYVQTGEPMDKAGAYALQGVGGRLVEWVRGSYSAVIGLPLAEVVQSYRKVIKEIENEKPRGVL